MPICEWCKGELGEDYAEVFSAGHSVKVHVHCFIDALSDALEVRAVLETVGSRNPTL